MKKISYSEINNTDIIISNVVCVNQAWKDTDTYTFDRTNRASTGLVLWLHASGIYTFPNGTKFHAPPYSVVTIPEESKYSLVVNVPTPVPYADILINFNIYDSDFTPLTLDFSVLTPKKLPKEVEELFSEISDIYLNSVNNILTIKSKLYRLINRLSALTYNETLQFNANDPVYAAVSYIENNLSEQISISGLSKLCATSEATLRRKFKTSIGMSPIEYTNKLKIEKSKQLLKIPEVSINSLCEQLNFYDASYFYKLFKRETGMTPLQYRKGTVEKNM